MFIEKSNSRDSQGNIGEARAILEFTLKGYIVSKPIFDAVYDLIVDDGTQLQRVSVKTSKYLRQFKTNTSYEVCLSTTIVKQTNATQSWDKQGRKDNVFDLLFILTEDNNCWIIPEDKIDGKFTIAVGGTSTKYDKYKLNSIISV